MIEAMNNVMQMLEDGEITYSEAGEFLFDNGDEIINQLERVDELEMERDQAYDEGYHDGEMEYSGRNQEAYDEGYEEGKADGYDEGYSDGHEDGLEAGGNE